MPFRNELYLPPDFEPRRTSHGCFQKGHVPFNKGKKWSDYMGKRAQKRAARGWKNLELHRPAHSENADRKRRPIIAVMNDGRWVWLPDSTKAQEWLGSGDRGNVNRCCRFNESKRRNLKNGKVNTDHSYMGVRFYFETDDAWTTKIKDK